MISEPLTFTPPARLCYRGRGSRLDCVEPSLSQRLETATNGVHTICSQLATKVGCNASSSVQRLSLLTKPSRTPARSGKITPFFGVTCGVKQCSKTTFFTTNESPLGSEPSALAIPACARVLMLVRACAKTSKPFCNLASVCCSGSGSAKAGCASYPSLLTCLLCFLPLSRELPCLSLPCLFLFCLSSLCLLVLARTNRFRLPVLSTSFLFLGLFQSAKTRSSPPGVRHLPTLPRPALEGLPSVGPPTPMTSPRHSGEWPPASQPGRPPASQVGPDAGGLWSRPACTVLGVPWGDSETAA